MTTICQTEGCDEVAIAAFDALSHLGMAICRRHSEYLLEFRDWVIEYAPEGTDEMFVRHNLLREAQALAYPIHGSPRLRALPGGIDEREPAKSARAPEGGGSSGFPKKSTYMP